MRELQDEVARLTSELRGTASVAVDPSDGAESLPAMTPREAQMEELTENLEILDVLKMSKEDEIRLDRYTTVTKSTRSGATVTQP